MAGTLMTPPVMFVEYFQRVPPAGVLLFKLYPSESLCTSKIITNKINYNICKCTHLNVCCCGVFTRVPSSLTGFQVSCRIDLEHTLVFIPQAKQSHDLFLWSGISDKADYKRNLSKRQCFWLSFLVRHKGTVPEMI